MLSFVFGTRLAASDILPALSRRWDAHRRRSAARHSFERLLASSDSHLLEDVGLDRPTAHRLLGEAPLLPHRAFDRWQV